MERIEGGVTSMPNPDAKIRNYLASIGRRGGKKSKRRLDPAMARNMVRVREAKRAFRKYFFECFWFADQDQNISINDVDWVAEQLKKYGSVECWKLARRLCP